MSKKVIIALLIAVTVVLAFTACTRSASPNIVTVPTSTTQGAAIPATPQPTDLSLVQAWGTSTAIYVQTAQAMGLITAVATQVPPQSTESTTPVIPPTGAAAETPVPGTTPIVVVPTATPGRPATYTLQTGEFPYCIARRFNLDPDDLLSLNGLSSGQILQPGLVLKIPQTGSYPANRALNAHPANYTVAVDDTIYRIACHFGDVDPNSIAAANGITLTTPLTTGQILYIP